LSSPACMYNLDASAFYIAFVLLHEYFTQKAKLLPYTTELSLQTWSISFSQQSRRNDRTFFKTASLQVRFFAINDTIASAVAVKFGIDDTVRTYRKSALLRSRSLPRATRARVRSFVSFR